VVCASSDYWPDHKGTFDPAALTIEFDEIGRRRVYGTAIVRSESDIWHKKNNSVTATDVLIIPTDSLSHDDAEFFDIKKFAESAFRRRDFTRSIALYREYFQCSKPDLMSLLCAARACMLLENTHDALSYYDQAIKLAPSHGSALTRKSCFLLKHRLGALTPQPQKKGRDQISMRSLGNKGRFGNQIFQYSFLKIYAEKFNLEIGTEEWAGQYIFSLNDPRPSTLPGVVRESQVNMIDALRSTECKLANKDITGYFQFHTNKWSAHRALFQSTFAPKGRFFDLLSPTISQIHATTDALIVLHLRRGDFGSTRFAVSPLNWHLEWLQEIWPQYRNPVLYIATDDPNIIQSFSDFSAIGFPDLEIDFDLNGIEYIADWIMIQQGSVLGLSNSTFSMSAALANHRANVFYRPDFSANRLIEFDPWNAPILVPD
jgi:tetratricopeptide (TPR) repeat protein